MSGRSRKHRPTLAPRRRQTTRPAEEPWQGVPRLTLGLPDDPLRHILHAASLALLKHPVAAQAAFAAFVAEGRRFAETAEGRRWKAALVDSDLVRRGTALWEGSVLNTLEDNSDALLPSTILDAIVQAAGRRDLLAFLHEIQAGIVDAYSHSS